MAYNRQTDAWPTTDRCMDVLTDRGMAYNRQTDVWMYWQTGAWPITDKQMYGCTDRQGHGL